MYRTLLARVSREFVQGIRKNRKNVTTQVNVVRSCHKNLWPLIKQMHLFRGKWVYFLFIALKRLTAF